ncbi:major capsid protein [Streptomyces xiamenensis]|uniref:major capsid protein n=1 Tax=Streptomyces xiamenensis TaxID=408015 RepID=UPI003D715AEC
MAVTLAQSALLTTEQLRRGVIEMFVQESPILDRLPLIDVEGSGYRYAEESELPGVSFRSVNESYPESVGILNSRTENLAILGGDSDVDKFIVKTRSNLNDQRAIQTQMKVKAASIYFSDQFFNGDEEVSPKGFDGLRKRLIGDQVIDGEGIAPVAGGHEFFDKLDQLVARVRGISGSNGALYTNADLIAKISSAHRRLGGSELLVREIANKATPTWKGIPLLDAGQRLDGADIIPATEGESGGKTSDIYAVRFGGSEADSAVSGLTNGGIQVTDLGEAHEKPVYRTRIEFYCGIAVFGGRAAARLTNIASS